GDARRAAGARANRTRGGRTWLRFVRRTRSPELPVILLEDSAALVGLLFALVGVGLSVLTGNGGFEGVSTLCIGVLLIGVAVLLAVETKSLLIGESALPEQVAAIEQALLSTPGVRRIIHLRTLHLGPEELLVAAKIGVGADDEGTDIAATIDNAEARVRAAVPTAKVIYLEPDIYRPDTATSAA